MCGHYTEENIRRNFFDSSESAIFESVGRLKDLRGYPTAEFMAQLEALGIGKIIIPTLLTWDYWNQHAIEETFVEEVAEAHEALIDVERRAAYDEIAQRHANGQPFEPPPGWDSGYAENPVFRLSNQQRG